MFSILLFLVLYLFVLAVINCERYLFYQVNILTHTAEVPCETYDAVRIKNTQKKMKMQDDMEIYGMIESGSELKPSACPVELGNKAVGEAPKASCSKENVHTLKDKSNGWWRKYTFGMK